jgi:hypothetical protein
MSARVAVGFCVLVAAATVAGCGGSGEASGGADTTPAVTETSTDTSTTEGPVDELPPAGPDTPLCREVTSTSSELNLAASNGDFTAVAARWEALRTEFPADLQPEVDTIVDGYGKVAADPGQYSVLETSPYKEALEAINAHTGSVCG